MAIARGKIDDADWVRLCAAPDVVKYRTKGYAAAEDVVPKSGAGDER